MFPKDYLSELGIDAQQLNFPLDETEQDTLADLLATAHLPDTTMTMEEFDGLCCALAVGPHRGENELSAHEWLPVVFGEDDPPVWPGEEGQQDAKRCYTLLLRHQRAVAVQLSVPVTELKQMEDEALYIPWVYEVDEADRVLPIILDKTGQRQGEWFGRWWAAGFCAALAEWQPDWQALLDDEDAAELVEPFVQLERGYDELDPSAPFDEDETLTRCILAAYEMRRWWQVVCAPRIPFRRVETPGRNAPCPCGSGKKYKKCCGKETD